MNEFSTIVAISCALAALSTVLVYLYNRLQSSEAAVSIPISCRCGCVSGKILDHRDSLRFQCYCIDCQNYAEGMKEFGANKDHKDDLNEFGGTDLVQVTKRQIHFEKGAEHIKVSKLTSSTSTLRIYADCCGSHFFNTANNVPVINVVTARMGKVTFDKPILLALLLKLTAGT